MLLCHALYACSATFPQCAIALLVRFVWLLVLCINSVQQAHGLLLYSVRAELCLPYCENSLDRITPIAACSWWWLCNLSIIECAAIVPRWLANMQPFELKFEGLPTNAC
jgi:hypothetical protein